MNKTINYRLVLFSFFEEVMGQIPHVSCFPFWGELKYIEIRDERKNSEIEALRFVDTY